MRFAVERILAERGASAIVGLLAGMDVVYRKEAPHLAIGVILHPAVRAAHLRYAGHAVVGGFVIWSLNFHEISFHICFSRVQIHFPPRKQCIPPALIWNLYSRCVYR